MKMSWDWHRLFLCLVNVCLSRMEGKWLLLLFCFKCWSLKRYLLCFILLPDRSYPSPSYSYFFIFFFIYKCRLHIRSSSRCSLKMSWDRHRLFLCLVNECFSSTEKTNLLFFLLFFKCFRLERYLLYFPLLPLILFVKNRSNCTYFWCSFLISFFFNRFFTSNSRRLNLIRRRFHINTQNFRLILNILLQEGLVNVKLLSSIHQKYLFSTLVKALIKLAIDEILDGSFGLHHKMGQSFTPL